MLPICSCPDYQKKKSTNPFGRTLSQQIASDWSANFTGVVDVGGGCIHSLAAIRLEGLIGKYFPNGIPTDYPTLPTLRVPPILYKNV